MDAAPGRWWGGPLDVERLAWSAVSDARRAAQSVADARGLRVTVGTETSLVAASFAAIEHLRVGGRAAEAWAPLSGFFAAADGWVRVHANYPHHAAALRRALGLGDRAAVDRAALHGVIAGRAALDVEQVVTAERGIAVAVRSPREWSAHPHGTATATDPWSTVRVTGDRPALPPSPDEILDGVRVLDLTRVVAGPTCSQLLACLGADVLRLDPPGRPELLDQHLASAMGKRSAAVDLAARPEVLNRLLPDADVVLLDYRPGSLARFGLDPDALTERHPHLVVASLSAWGEHGPWGARAGFDSIVQAASGIAVVCAAADGRPGALPVQALDHATGHRMAAEVLRLLAQGRAGVVRISLLGAARELLAAPPPAPEATSPLAARTVAVPSPYGPVVTAPPALILDGATLERPVGGYAATTAGLEAGPDLSHHPGERNHP
ncbi:CoA transferase [Arsenicicoccus dermatophilus]|uniref:CoA transferase n=1 Tax=Arsenicicoccus dermatophilus TaxID=1076331 RepID=UPI00391701AC